MTRRTPACAARLLPGCLWTLAPGLVALGLLLGAPPVARAGSFSNVSQLREVRADTTDATTGYTCLDGILPACPVDLGTTTPSDLHAAPDFAPFVATATTPGATADHASEIGSTRLAASASAQVNASASTESSPSYLLVLRTVDPSTRDDFDVEVAVDEATPFVLEIGGFIEYPDPAFPFVWDASLSVVVTGPGGELASRVVVPDFGCASDPETFLCRVEPAEVTVSGILAPGTYRVDAELVTSAGGSWLPSTGPLSGYAAGAYDVELRLLSDAALLPMLGPTSTAVLVFVLAGAGFLGSRVLLRR
jgi:hypothetical protein